MENLHLLSATPSEIKPSNSAMLKEEALNENEINEIVKNTDKGVLDFKTVGQYS